MNEPISVKKMIEEAVKKSGTLRISIIKGAFLRKMTFFFF